MEKIKFSICIPNYNYGEYVGQTIKSILDQDYSNLELLVSDNCSTDNSWEIIQKYVSIDKRIKAWKNNANLGFSGNLDTVSKCASGDYHLMVSSDDLMNPGALQFYHNFLNTVAEDKIVFSSACLRINASGIQIGYDGPKSKLWRPEDIDKSLTSLFGCDIYKVPSNEMLRRCLSTFYGPFNFVSACYSVYHVRLVGDYGGSRMYNPDKWLHWRLLSVTDFAYYIDKPLFSYRWHDRNQAALQLQSGALKYLVDEYRNSFEVDTAMLEKACLSHADLKRSFVLNVIHKNVFANLKSAKLTMARRIFHFGWATYPSEMLKSKYTLLFSVLLRLGKLGVLIAKPFKKNYKPN